MNYKKHTFALALLVLAFGCSEKKEVVIPPKKIVIKSKGDLASKNTSGINWEGYYTGKLPCDDCKGITTWLWLKNDNGESRYALKEDYGIKEVISQGGIEWLRGGTVGRFYNANNRMLFLAEGSATFINSPRDTVNDKYTLVKMDDFSNENATMILDPKTVMEGRIKGKTAIKFRALTNLKVRAPLGYKSLRATYVIHCKSNEFEMSRVLYREDNFLLGKNIKPIDSVSGKLFAISPTNTIMQEVKEKYCPKRKKRKHKRKK